ncbi:hypothetical protein QAD02_002306 [Eretmocerus hayati]|uniref:Uncharacterized protein n=1 Tax=Eretmocerus hayati TaxID=131215 RepID=A0ACC2NIW6_9HYME|nr:hypothetical protein QAD02_002306 [Eretmocerus hayati]
MLQTIVDKMNEMAADVDNLNNKFETVQSMIKETVSEELAVREKQWETENVSLRARIDRSEHSEEMRARRGKRNNIVLRGLQPLTENVEAGISTWLAANLQVDAQVVDATVIKPLRGPELIIANIASADAKRKVMSTKKTKLASTNFSIRSDLTNAERAVQREIYTIADAERERRGGGPFVAHTDSHPHHCAAPLLPLSIPLPVPLSLQELLLPADDTPAYTKDDHAPFSFWNLRGSSTLNLVPSRALHDLQHCAFLCFSESWAHEEIRNIPATLQDFTLFQKPASKEKLLGRANGGLGVFANPAISSHSTKCAETSCYLAVKCLIDQMQLIIISVYISAVTFPDDLECLRTYISVTLNNVDGPLIIGGDFNARIGNENQTNAKALADFDSSATKYTLDETLNKQGRLLLREFEHLGLTYSLCLLIFFLLEMGVAIIGFVFPHSLQSLLEESFTDKIIQTYREDPDLQNFIDFGQKEFKCCGLSQIGYLDWGKNEYFNCSSPSSESCGVPFSCCINATNIAVSFLEPPDFSQKFAIFRMLE